MQGPSRRQVCAGSALAGISWALAGCAPDEPLAGERPPGAAGPPSLAEFRQAVGSMVTVEVNGAPRSLLLTALRDHGAPVRGPRPRGQSFTLLLDAGGSAIAAGQTYRASHAALGPFTLFLVSHALPGRDRPLYSATFSRI